MKKQSLLLMSVDGPAIESHANTQSRVFERAGPFNFSMMSIVDYPSESYLLRAIVVLFFRAGVPPSKTKTGRMWLNKSLQAAQVVSFKILQHKVIKEDSAFCQLEYLEGPNKISRASFRNRG